MLAGSGQLQQRVLAAAGLDFCRRSREAPPMILPDLPLLTGTLGTWLLLGVKILAAMGFMAAADLVILYAS